MAGTSGFGLPDYLNTDKIFEEAQECWLRPDTICGILKNHKKFRITSELARMPRSGSLLLFDRNVSKHFRKDGHNWKKKKGGNTVTEANERLKVGDIPTLQCYYAHGEENGNFQRRSYWMIEKDLSHIVLVHYRDVKGNRTNFNHIKETKETILYRLETEGIISNSEVETMSSSLQPSNAQIPSQTTDTTSMHGVQASECEDAKSDDSYGKPSGTGFQLTPREHTLENCTPGDESAQFLQSFVFKQHDNMGPIFINSFNEKLQFEDLLASQEGWLGPVEPSLSDEQLYSITDFSPEWAFVGEEIEVRIRGRFLKSRDEAWSCMFGEVEVPAEVIEDGVLRCYTPRVNKAGRVPFYVTCSNRLACSEVREFEH